MDYKLKKAVFYVVMVLMALTIIFTIFEPSFTGWASKDKTDSKIDKEILKAFEENDMVDVIIILKDNLEKQGLQTQSERMEERKQKVKQIQNDFLSSINYVNYTKNKEEKNETKKNKITGLFAEEEPDLELKHKYQILNQVSGRINKNSLKKLESNPNVKYIEIDKPLSINLDTSTSQIKATDVHAININGNNITGKGQTVCVIDTGVDYNNAYMGGGWGNKVVDGYDYYNGDPDPMDDNGHGTHVAGIVASTNPTYQGVAPDANIVAYKVCDSTGHNCYSSLMELSIEECILNKTTLNISVITISIGGGEYNSNCDNLYPSFAEAVNLAVSNGIFISAASGNALPPATVGYNDSITFPACLANVTSVGSVDKSDVIAQSSNVANFLDILAPGMYINSLCAGGSAPCTMSGTSMATPHVAGEAALIYQYEKEINGRNATSQEVRALLTRSNTIINVTRAGMSFPRLGVLDSINSVMQINESSNTIQDRPGNAKIIFGSAFGLGNSSEAVIIKNNFISVDTINHPEFAGKAANLTLFNLTFQKTPVIYKDGVWCNETCLITGYDSKNLSFSVTGFSNYTAGPNSQLEIFDDVDLGIISRTYQDVYFYANYTNITSGVPISSGICNISFDDGVNGSMSYSGGLFNYTRRFDYGGPPYVYNISCNDTNYEPLQVQDDIVILPSCKNSTGGEVSQELPNNDWIITNDNVTCSNAIIYFQNQTLILGENSIFVLNNSKLILNESINAIDIIINESSFLNVLNSEIIGKSNRFNIKSYGQNNLSNITTNNSQVYLSGNKTNFVYDSTFYFVLTLNGNSSNIVKNSVFLNNLELKENSTNIIENASLLNLIISENSNNTIINLSISNEIQSSGTASTYAENITSSTLNIYDASKIDFGTTKQSKILTLLTTRQFLTAIIKGYVDMPNISTIVFGTPSINRYYPVHVNYTNGSPAVGKIVNITNGTDILFSGVTDSNGFVNPNLTWNGTTKDLNYTIYVNPAQNISLLEDTPIIFILGVPSIVTLYNPLNNTNFSTPNIITINFNFSFTDDNLTNNCSLYIDGTLNQTNDTTLNSTITNFLVNVGIGNHNWYINCSDGQYESISEVWYFNVTQDFPPAIDLNNPLNNTQINNTNTITLNFTAIDDINTTLSCDLYINDQYNQTDSSVINGIITNFIIPVTPGSYNWSVNCTDGYSSNVSETWYFSINDTYSPAVNLNSPANGISTGNKDINFNWTATNSDPTLTCNLTLDGTVNVSNIIVSSGIAANQTITNISLGTHWWNVTCWDSANNINTSETWNFTIVPNLPPNVTLNSPADNATIYNRTIPFNFTPIDDLNTTLICSIYIDGTLNQTNISINNTPSVFRINLTGTHEWYINCSDGSLSNVSETRNITAIYCGDSIINGPEQCEGSNLSGETCTSLGYDKGTLACTALCTFTGCSNNAGGGSSGGSSGGGGSSPILPPTLPETEEEPEEIHNTAEVVATNRNLAPKKTESPAEITANPIKMEASGTNTGVIFLWALILLVIITLFPFIIWGRRYFAEDEVIKILIAEENLAKYRKIWVTREVYDKYKEILKKADKPNNLQPIVLKEDDYKAAANIKHEFHISDELAKLVAIAKKGIINVILLKEDVSEKLRKKFRRIKFEKIEHDRRNS